MAQTDVDALLHQCLLAVRVLQTLLRHVGLQAGVACVTELIADIEAYGVEEP